MTTSECSSANIQDALALACNIDRSYVGWIERGKVIITVEKLYRIASVLACDPCGLLPPVAFYPVNTETFE